MLLLAGARRRFLLLADLRLILSSLTSPHGRIFFACPSAWAHPLCLLIRLDVSYYIFCSQELNRRPRPQISAVGLILECHRPYLIIKER